MDARFSLLAISFLLVSPTVAIFFVLVRTAERNANQDSAFFVTSKVSVSINILVMKTTPFQGRFADATTRLDSLME